MSTTEIQVEQRIEINLGLLSKLRDETSPPEIILAADYPNVFVYVVRQRTYFVKPKAADRRVIGPLASLQAANECVRQFSLDKETT
jgi:hypothetical protein